MERVDQIYYEIIDSCALHDQVFSDFTSDDLIAITCTAHVVEELRQIRELLQNGSGRSEEDNYIKERACRINPRLRLEVENGTGIFPDEIPRKNRVKCKRR